MLVYLDANIVQYCADYGDFVFRREGARCPPNQTLEVELIALAEVVEIVLRAEAQDLDHRWDVAGPPHLIDELHRGRPTQEQLETYDSLCQAWRDLGLERHRVPDDAAVNSAQDSLRQLLLRDQADQRHLAEAVAMGASWFLTLDKDILDKTRDLSGEPGVVQGVIVARPSELCERMSFDPVFGLEVLADRRTSR